MFAWRSWRRCPQSGTWPGATPSTPPPPLFITLAHCSAVCPMRLAGKLQSTRRDPPFSSPYHVGIRSLRCLLPCAAESAMKPCARSGLKCSWRRSGTVDSASPSSSSPTTPLAWS